jgi:hypothetical protein
MHNAVHRPDDMWKCAQLFTQLAECIRVFTTCGSVLPEWGRFNVTEGASFRSKQRIRTGLIYRPVASSKAMSPALMAGLIRGISTICGFMRPVPAFYDRLFRLIPRISIFWCKDCNAYGERRRSWAEDPSSFSISAAQRRSSPQRSSSGVMSMNSAWH